MYNDFYFRRKSSVDLCHGKTMIILEDGNK